MDEYRSAEGSRAAPSFGAERLNPYSPFLRSIIYNSNMANGQWGRDVESPRAEQPKPAKLKGGGAVVVGACLIAAVKIAQDRSWDKPAHSPKITATISNAITIAKKIYDRVAGTFPELF